MEWTQDTLVALAATTALLQLGLLMAILRWHPQPLQWFGIHLRG